MKSLFSRRWFWIVVTAVLLLAFVGTAAAWLGLQQFAGRVTGTASSVWHNTLEWAGLRGGDADSDTIYWCPMHPQIKRTNPNDVCPICNMALVELEGDGQAEPPLRLTLTSRQVQQAGVVTRPVLRRKLYREIDTTGRVEQDERRLAKITSWVRGNSRLTRLHVNFTGQEVQQGELLAELYSPELVTAQRDFLRALETTSLVRGADLVGASRERLQEQGMTSEQIDRLQRTKDVASRLPVHAPISGTVIRRHVQEGQYVAEGNVLFEITDLSHLWLYADVYEDELALVSEGQPAKINVRSIPGEAFEGTVAFIDPVVQRETRTVRVRIEVENPHRRLKPGMFAIVQLRQELPETLAVPEEAVLWSGQRQVVLVKEGEGSIRPREVRLGQRWLYPAEVRYQPGGLFRFGGERERYHQVLAGLGPGDEVVAAGTFLLSAESQFQNVLTKMLPAESETATLEEVLGEATAGRLRDVLEAYYELSASLADDRLELVSSQAGTLAETAEVLNHEASENGMSDLARAAGRLVRFARRLAENTPDDLHQARIGFGRISRELIGLLAEHGGKTLLGRELFVFRCGMSKVGYENWVWWSEELHNPYMGQRMLRCGTELKTFEDEAT